MFRFFISLLILFPLTLLGNKSEIINKNFKPTLSWLKEQPKSYAKDFFIIQFLKDSNTTIDEAKEAFSMARNKNGRVRQNLNKNFSVIPKEELRCYTLKTHELLKQSNECIALGLTLSEAAKLYRADVKKIIKKLDKYPTLKNDLSLMASKKFYKDALKTNIHRYYRVFFKAGKKFRKNKFNYKMPQFYINELSNHKNFNKYVRYIVTNDNLNRLQKSLFNVKDNKYLNQQTLFFLSINALKHYKTSIALKYLDLSYKKAYFQMDKDRAIFWKYLITKKTQHLDMLSKSWDNNLYSLYAKELLTLPITNIEYKLDFTNSNSTFNSSNQFEWIKVLKDIRKKLDDKKIDKYKSYFSSNEHLAHYTYVLAQKNRYETQYYITPYENIFSKYDLQRQVLLYSIARQESHFIPSSISSATALGVMQIMPFLSKSIAKKMNVDYHIYEQFNPKINIDYASFHLNGLEKSFKNPLFIAYAYNGGPGYARSQFKKGLFSKKGRYEPFLSMELISYDETRKYGKKVLSNYYIYNNYLNKNNKITLNSIFQTLVW